VYVKGSQSANKVGCYSNFTIDLDKHNARKERIFVICDRVSSWIEMVKMLKLEKENRYRWSV
jgi:hypothetical protein